MDITKLCQQIQTAIETGGPATNTQAREQADAAEGLVDELTEWLSTVQDLAADVEAAYGELADAADGDYDKRSEAAEARQSAHSQLVDALTSLRDELVTSLPGQPAP